MSRKAHKRRRKRPASRPPAMAHDPSALPRGMTFEEDLQPQYDTVNEEPYFITSDGYTLTLEQAGRYLEERELARKRAGL